MQHTPAYPNPNTYTKANVNFLMKWAGTAAVLCVTAASVFIHAVYVQDQQLRFTPAVFANNPAGHTADRPDDNTFVPILYERDLRPDPVRQPMPATYAYRTSLDTLPSCLEHKDRYCYLTKDTVTKATRISFTQYEALAKAHPGQALWFTNGFLGRANDAYVRLPSDPTLYTMHSTQFPGHSLLHGADMNTYLSTQTHTLYHVGGKGNQDDLSS